MSVREASHSRINSQSKSLNFIPNFQKSSNNLKLNDKLQSRYIKNTIYYLLMKENFVLLNKEDQDYVIKLKRKIDLGVYRGLIFAALSYSVFFKFVIKKDLPFRSFKAFRKPFKRLIDISCLIFIPILISSYNIRDLKKEISNVERLKKEYSLILKNSILQGQDPFNFDNKEGLTIIINQIHHSSERSFYFLFLLLLRILL
jgi:hypothetical protein